MTVYTISNIVGLLFLWAAIEKPKLARLLFLLLFSWARFPFSITVGLAAYFILLKDDKNFLWEYKTHPRKVLLQR